MDAAIRAQGAQASRSTERRPEPPCPCTQGSHSPSPQLHRHCSHGAGWQGPGSTCGAGRRGKAAAGRTSCTWRSDGPGGHRGASASTPAGAGAPLCSRKGARGPARAQAWAAPVGRGPHAECAERRCPVYPRCPEGTTGGREAEPRALTARAASRHRHRHRGKRAMPRDPHAGPGSAAEAAGRAGQACGGKE